MLQQSDKTEFIQAMELEVAEHESRCHRSFMKINDFPEGAKTILAIWSFKRKLYSDGSINKYRLVCVHMVVYRLGESISEKPMHQW